jgi:hypothetical protein
VTGTDHERPQRVDGVFSAVARWTGSHWAFVVAAVLVIVSLLTTDVEETNLAISIVTLLMVLVLQNTQNRDSAALHLSSTRWFEPSRKRGTRSEGPNPGPPGRSGS